VVVKDMVKKNKPEPKAKEFPEIKKSISSYLKLEDGKISKEAILTVGAFVTSAAASAALLSKSVSAYHSNTTPHSNVAQVKYGNDVAIGQHSHHTSHANTHSSY
jgi:hypothetical protein